MVKPSPVGADVQEMQEQGHSARMVDPGVAPGRETLVLQVGVVVLAVVHAVPLVPGVRPDPDSAMYRAKAGHKGHEISPGALEVADRHRLETVEQLRVALDEESGLVRRLSRTAAGCDLAQGRLLARPRPADQLTVWSRERGAAPCAR